MSDDITEYFLNSKSSLVLYECLTLRHPNFQEPHHLVRNSINGLRARLETGGFRDHIYTPMAITPSSSRNDLNFSIQVQLGDLGETFPQELDRVLANEGFLIRPRCDYRAWRSDRLEIGPTVGPILLQVDQFDFNENGCQFNANPQPLNFNSTGRLYTLTDFPMLRGTI